MRQYDGEGRQPIVWEEGITAVIIVFMVVKVFNNDNNNDNNDNNDNYDNFLATSSSRHNQTQDYKTLLHLHPACCRLYKNQVYGEVLL